MSTKRAVVLQYDARFAKVVREELEGVVPDSREERVACAVRCAALAVLARPEIHDRLLGRLTLLLKQEVSLAFVRGLIRDVSASRRLAYEDGRETHVTVSEAARRLGVARSTIYRWLGESDRRLSPMHDDPDLGPQRITIATLGRMKGTAAEKAEIDLLRKILEDDLSNYEMREYDELLGKLNAVEGPLTGREVKRVATDRRILVSDATVRRWPAVKVDRVYRGRPRRIYSIEIAAESLAKQARRQRTRTVRSTSTPLLRLQQLRREIPSVAR